MRQKDKLEHAKRKLIFNEKLNFLHEVGESSHDEQLFNFSPFVLASGTRTNNLVVLSYLVQSLSKKTIVIIWWR